MAIILNVPYAEKDQAKALGAYWHPIKRVWCVPDGMLIEPFECWLPTFEKISNVVKVQKIPFGVSGKVKKPAKSAKSFDQHDYGMTTGANYIRSVCRHIPWEICMNCKV